MRSVFKTGRKEYELKTDKYICNKFGLAEFLCDAIPTLEFQANELVLDVGCGAGPIGIFFADQLGCRVKGIELNPIAYECCKDNISRNKLEDRFTVLKGDFSKMIDDYHGEKVKYIIANPPIDNTITMEEIRRFEENDFSNLDDDSYSYLTNSWHSLDGRDLLDYIFLFANKHLERDGKIILVVCLMDCDSVEYVLNCANFYSWTLENKIEGEIKPESIGAETVTTLPITTYLLKFSRGELNDIY